MASHEFEDVLTMELLLLMYACLEMTCAPLARRSMAEVCGKGMVLTHTAMMNDEIRQ